MRSPEGGRNFRIAAFVPPQLSSVGRPASEASTLSGTQKNSLSTVGSSRVRSLGKRIPFVEINPDRASNASPLFNQNADKTKINTFNQSDRQITDTGYTNESQSTVPGIRQRNTSRKIHGDNTQPVYRLEPFLPATNAGNPSDSYKKVSADEVSTLVHDKQSGYPDKLITENNEITPPINTLDSDQFEAKESFENASNHIVFIAQSTFQYPRNQPVSVQVIDHYSINLEGNIDSQKTLAIYSLKNLMLLVYIENNFGSIQNAPFPIEKNYHATDIQRPGINRDDLDINISEDTLQNSMLPVYLFALIGLLTDEEINNSISSIPSSTTITQPLVPNYGQEDTDEEKTKISNMQQTGAKPNTNIISFNPTLSEHESNERDKNETIAVIIFMRVVHTAPYIGDDPNDSNGFDDDNPDDDGNNGTRDDYTLAA